MTPIENRELRGITNRIVVVVIMGVITMTAGGVGFYLGLMNKIDKVTTTQELRKEQVDTQLNAINLSILGVKDDIKDVKSDIRDIRNKKN